MFGKIRKWRKSSSVWTQDVRFLEGDLQIRINRVSLCLVQSDWRDRLQLLNSSIAPFPFCSSRCHFFLAPFFFLGLMREGLSGSGSGVRSLFLFKAIVLCTLYFVHTSISDSTECRDRFDQSLILACLSAASVFCAIIVVTCIYQSFFFLTLARFETVFSFTIKVRIWLFWPIKKRLQYFGWDTRDTTISTQDWFRK